MTVLGLVLYAVFVATTVVGRVALQVHRSGDTGLRFGGLRGWELVSGVGLVAAWVLGLAALAHGPDNGVPTTAALAGVVLFAAGWALTIWAQLAMADSWRIGVDPTERTELVTSGPFAGMRNPIFTGMTLTLAGICLLAWSPVGWAAVAVQILCIEVQTRLVEEPYLRRIHPEYAAYEKSVGRFIPRP